MYRVSAFPTVQETSAIAVVVTTALVELEVLKLNSEKKMQSCARWQRDPWVFLMNYKNTSKSKEGR